MSIWSQEAEQSVLGALLIEPEAIFRIADLGIKPAEFFDSHHRALWVVLQDLIGQGKAIDTVTAHDRAKALGRDVGDLGYLNALAQCVPSASHVRRYAEIVRGKALERALLAAAESVQQIVAGSGESGEKVVKAIEVFLSLQQARGAASSMLSLAEAVMARTQHYDDAASGKTEAGWSTGLPDLDRMLCGGFRPGSLIITAARPSVGKSSLSQQWALTLATAGKRGLFLSQEMTTADLADRAVANMARVSMSELSTRLADESWSRVLDACERAKHLPLTLDDQAALTLLDIRTKARLIQHRDGLDFIVVDYLQLCSGEGEKRYQQIEQVSRGLKALAKDLKVAVIALAQLNRDVESRGVARPTLADLRDSGSIEQDADAVLFLWRPEPDNRALVQLTLAKNRQGPCGETSLHFDGEKQRWNEMVQKWQAAPPKARGFQARGESWTNRIES